MADETRDIPYIAVEGIITHLTRIIRRLILLCVAFLLAIILIVAGFLWYISLPVEESSTVTVENQDGNANYIGNNMNGDFIYGESKEN